MTDIVKRLRMLYLDTGMNYVQEAADTIERLRSELELIKSDLCNTQVAFNDWKVAHSTIHLEAENERLKQSLSDTVAALQASEKSNEILKAERDALREDAERYRWLRGQLLFWVGHAGVFKVTNESIDAARKP